MFRVDAPSRRMLRARDKMDRSFDKPLDVAALARGYDHHFVHPEWVPELKSRYGLKLLGEE